MTTRFFVAIVALLTLFVVCGSAFEADAARFGGGRSFGGSSGFSRSFNSSRLPNSGVTNPSATQRQPGAVSQGAGTAARPGFGGMGGIFGGLLAGTLLGSLLAGHGFAGGGMLDILLIGLGVYLLFKFLGRRRASQQAYTGSGMGMPVPDRDARDTTHRYSASGQNNDMWGALGGGGQSAPSAERTDIPQDFDVADFMRGAKMIYTRMNDSWDRRDLDDIAEFSTRPFMAEISRQAVESPKPETTEIMMVNADIVDVHKEAGREMASVFFDVTLREQGMSSPSRVREVWHFVRAADSRDMWKLDGIQQVED